MNRKKNPASHRSSNILNLLTVSVKINDRESFPLKGQSPMSSFYMSQAMREKNRHAKKLSGRLRSVWIWEFDNKKRESLEESFYG